MPRQLKDNDFAKFTYLSHFLIAGALLLLAVLGTAGWEGANKITFITALWSTYVAFEVRREVRDRGFLALLSPAVLFSTMTMFLAFSLPIIGLFWDDYTFVQTIYWLRTADVSGVLSYVAVLCGIFIFAYWRGYRFPLAGQMAAKIRRHKWASVVRPDFNLNVPAIAALYACAIVARFIQIKLGIYGFASDPNALVEYASYRSYLDYFSGTGKLVLLLTAIWAFKAPTVAPRFWLSLILATEIVFGILSGFKGQAVFPIVFVGFAFLLERQRMPLKWIIAAIIGIYLSYAIVEPFRAVRNNDVRFQSTSISAIIDAIVSPPEAYTENVGATENVWWKVFSRMSVLPQTAAGINYVDTDGEGRGIGRNFLKGILLAPIYAFIPRIVWAGKPLNDHGDWNYIHVIGHGANRAENSVTLGVVSDLYFAGGIIGVIVGGWILGLFARLIFETLIALGYGGILIYLIIAPRLALVSDVDVWLAGTVQLIPTAIFVQAIVLRKRRSSKAQIFGGGLPQYSPGNR